MKYLSQLGATALMLSLIAGCGSEDFSGAYKTDGPSGQHLVLNVEGKSAKLFLVDKHSAEIGRVFDFDVSYKGEKMLLDSTTETPRLVFKRAVDERSLECLNCAEPKLHLPINWAFANQKPYDVNAMLAAQEETRREAQKKIEKHRAEATKLTKFEGDWVLKRNYKDDSLFIMSISKQIGVKQWAFNYSTTARLSQLDRPFSVDGDNLVLEVEQGSSTSYVLSEDGQELRCSNCTIKKYWKKADPVKVNDLAYSKNLAEDPQEPMR